MESHYSAREFIGCVTEDDVRSRREQRSTDAPPGAHASFYSYPEMKRPGESWHHYKADCICRRLHEKCDPAGYPKSIEEDWEVPFGNRKPNIPDLTVGVTYQHVKDASESGCWFCSIIYAGVRDAPEGALTELQHKQDPSTITVKAENGNIKKIGRPYLAVTLTDGGDNICDFPKYEFYRLNDTDTGHICACFRSAPVVPISTALPESFAFAKQQMAICANSIAESHACCEVGEVQLPTRVLEIGELDGKYTVRLFITHGLKGKYLALSHCWGSKVHITTTTATIEEREAGIPWDSLSQTFRDAIHITHRFGFRYLWIDALCILQDNVVDWRLESGRMHTIYQNCSLMISADHAEDGSKGCFSNGVAHSWQVQMFPHKAKIYVRRTKFHAGVYRAGRSPFYAKLGALAQRAWAFQERTLAPRILHYTVDELIWECGATYACQCGDVDSDIGFGGRKFLFKNCEADGLIGVWQGLIADHTARLLTKSEDRLPSFSGIAQTFKRTWDVLNPSAAEASSRISAADRVVDESEKNQPRDLQGCDAYVNPNNSGLGQYLAGLWSNHLKTLLPWVRRNMRHVLLQKPPTYIAPSWSWASLDSDVMYYSERVEVREISVLEASCTAIDLDPTGAVKEGHLKLSGPIVELKITRVSSGDPDKYYSLQDYAGLNLSENYEPDYLLQGEDASEAEGVGLASYGLVMAPDFVMVLKKSRSMPHAYERIGSISFFPGYTAEPKQPDGWTKDAVKKAITIV